MARLLEHHAKELLRQHGIAVPRSLVAGSPKEARTAAQELGEIVLKALVPHNRRAKLGGVRFPAGMDDVEREAAELFAADIAGTPVPQRLVEERLPLERELYLSFLVDTTRRRFVAVASAQGGVEIEETEDLVTRTVDLDPWRRHGAHRFRDLWLPLGLREAELLQVADLSKQAAQVFFSVEATILELNPVGLVRTDGGVRPVAIGAVLAVDDQALARHPELAALANTVAESWRPPTELERQAYELAAREPYRGTARFMELEGEIGLLTGGGGGSLVYFDAVRRAGGRPACFTEIGGNPSAEKVRELARIVLSVPGVQGLLVGHNITSNTQVDLVADGVVAALAELDLDPRTFPVVAREVGTHDQRGRAVFEAAGIEYLGEEATLDAAASRIVERVNAARAALR